MSEYDEAIEALLASKRVKRSVETWRGDFFLSRLLASVGERAVSVNALANPLRLVSNSKVSLILFDYAFFMLIRDLCRSLTLGGATNGALLALYQFEVGRGLDAVGLSREGAGLLRSACELRASFAVHSESSINEAAVYQIALNASMAHERAHHLFAEDGEIREAWLDEARSFVNHLTREADRMYADERARRDIVASAELFLANDGLLEEVACDVCAIDSCIREAVTQRADMAERYCDVYYAASRLNMLALFLTRTLADAAAMVVEETVTGRLGAIARHDEATDLSFMSSVRLRFQILMLKVASLKVRHCGAATGFRHTSDVLATQDGAFAKLAESLMLEIHEARRSITIHRQIWIGHASRSLAPNAEEPDNGLLISLFQTPFWFAPIDLYSHLD